MSPIKILVSGDVNGKLDALYKRIAAVHKKAGKFDLLYCVGDFFGNDGSQIANYIDGKSVVPLPTFIVGPVSRACQSLVPNNTGCEICPNITYLGRKGIYTDSSGLRIVYLSPIENSLYSDAALSVADVTALMNLSGCEETSFQGVDLLLSAQWPAGIERLAMPLEEEESSQQFGSSLVAKCAQVLLPRYHFSGLEGLHYERQPYRNHQVLQEKDRHTTRFIGLAKVKNTDNKKYLYALQLKPLVKMESKELTCQSDDVTECPFVKDEEEVVQAREMEVQTDQYFFDVQTKKKESRKRKAENIEKKMDKRQREYSPCWFCLGNPKVEKHLVLSVGMQTYLALPRGPLVQDHILLLPIGHHQSTRACPKNVLDEIDLYKKALRRMYKTQNKVMVVFERNFKSHHLQLQVVAIPLSVAGECKKAFHEGARKMKENFQLEEIPFNTDMETVVPLGIPYFSVELPSKERLFGRLTKEQCPTFDLQFGRTVLAGPTMLNCPERIDWHNCIESKEAETALTESLRDEFAPFNFSADVE